MNASYKSSATQLIEVLNHNDYFDRIWSIEQIPHEKYSQMEVFLTTETDKPDEHVYMTLNTETNTFESDQDTNLSDVQLAAIRVFLQTDPLIRTDDVDNVAVVAQFNSNNTVDVLRKVDDIYTAEVDKNVPLEDVLANPVYHFTDSVFDLFDVEKFLTDNGYNVYMSENIKLK